MSDRQRTPPRGRRPGDVPIRCLNNLSWLRLTQRVLLSELLTWSAQVRKAHRSTEHPQILREEQVRLLFSTTVRCNTFNAADIICQNHPQKHAAAHLTKCNPSTGFQQKTSCVLGLISLTSFASWRRHSFSFSWPNWRNLHIFFCLLFLSCTHILLALMSWCQIKNTQIVNCKEAASIVQRWMSRCCCASPQCSWAPSQCFSALKTTLYGHRSYLYCWKVHYMFVMFFPAE